jgi:lipopolysaccharide export system protein LptA
MKGERFVMDLATGKSRFEPGGRVSSHIAARGSPASPRKPAQSGGPLGASQLDLSSTRGQPIDIQSDTVTLDDRAKVAVFAGDVRVVQGDMTLQSRELHVNYSGSATGGASANAAASQITSITAEGKVLVTSKDQSSTSDWAKFDAASHTITIGGNVVLSQGQNVIKGDRLVIDTITGRSRFENERDQATGGRVRGLFQPKSDRDGTGRTGNSGLPFGGMASPR